jgi:hypothetical protein
VSTAMALMKVKRIAQSAEDRVQNGCWHRNPGLPLLIVPRSDV